MALEYTYALQYLAKEPQGGEMWKIVRTEARESVTGLLRANRDIRSVELAEHGPRLLSRLLSMPGKSDAFYRLALWEGNVPDEQLDDRRACTFVYDM